MFKIFKIYVTNIQNNADYYKGVLNSKIFGMIFESLLQLEQL